MTRATNFKVKKMRTPKRWCRLMPLILIACSTSGLTGCAHRLVVLPADKTVVRLPAGKPYTPSSDGYFVPQGRMQDILDRLSEKDVFGK
jgi:hypothetical protein